MADNITTPIPNSTVFATDDIGGIIYPRTKLSFGVDGSATDVSSSNPMPIVVSNSSIPVTGTFWPATQPVSGTVSVSGSVAVTGTFWQATQPISATSLPLPSGAATSAKQPAFGTAGSPSADILTVQGATTGTPILTVPVMSSGGNIDLTTNTTGSTFNTFASQACKQLTIVNNTGTTIEFRQGGAGVAVPIFDKAAFTVFGITNTNQIGIRRTDVSNTTVTVQARWES